MKNPISNETIWVTIKNAQGEDCYIVTSKKDRAIYNLRDIRQSNKIVKKSANPLDFNEFVNEQIGIKNEN